jgi:hypothetical protein
MGHVTGIDECLGDMVELEFASYFAIQISSNVEDIGRMARLGVAPHVVEAVLNHKSGTVRGVAAVYNRYSYSIEKREALDLWAEHVTRCAGNIIIARPRAAADNRELEAA